MYLMQGLLAFILAIVVASSVGFLVGNHVNLFNSGLRPEEPVPVARHIAKACEAAADEESGLRIRVKELEEQLRGSEARRRFSERARERDNHRHDKELRSMDAQVTTLNWKLREALFAKDQVICESRQWRRKFEDLESLQQQAREDPVREIRGRPRWAPAKSYGVGKRERRRPGKDLTTVAKVALVNAVWETKMRVFEDQVRSHVADQETQIRSLHAAVTTLSQERESHLEQHVSNSVVSEQLVQKLVSDAEERIKLIASVRHEEIISELKQTHLEELAAAKGVYEGEVREMREKHQAEKIELMRQQLASAAQQTPDVPHDQMQKLRESHERTIGDLEARGAECGRLQSENARLAEANRNLERKMVEVREESHGYLENRRDLEEEIAELRSSEEDLQARENELNAEVNQLEANIQRLTENLTETEIKLELANEAMGEMSKLLDGEESDEEDALAGAVEDVNLGA